MLFGCLVVALLSGPYVGEDRYLPLWAVVAAPVVLWLLGFGAFQVAILAKSGAPGLIPVLALLGTLPMLGVPMFSIVAYSAFWFRIGRWVKSSTGRAGSVLHYGVWLSAIVAPFIWAMAQLMGQVG